MKRFLYLFMVFIMALQAVPAFAADFSVVKNGVNVEILGDDTVLSGMPYSFSLSMAQNVALTKGYVDISSPISLNKNTGEGIRKDTVFLPQTADETWCPEIIMEPDNDSPLRGMLSYKRIIKDSVNAGTPSTYVQNSVSEFLSQKPSVISFGFWIKESDASNVFGSSTFDFWPIYDTNTASYIQIGIPVNSLIQNAGTPRAITPESGTNHRNIFTSSSISSACLERDNGWAYIVCNIENIVYNVNYSPSSSRFYTIFDNVSGALRQSGKKIEITNFTYLAGAKIASGYVLYPSTASQTSFRYVLKKDGASFTIPQSLVLGNLNIYALASQGVGNSSVNPENASYDKNIFGQNRQVSIAFNSNGNNLLGITYNGASLEENNDYTVSGNVYTIQNSFLDSLDLGVHNIVFNTDFGASPSAAVNVENTSGTYLMTCAVNGNNIAVRTPYGETQDLVQQFTGLTSQSSGNNDIINFSTASIIDKTESDIFKTGLILSSCDDEAAPFNLNSTYIGANHGLSFGVVVNLWSHGKNYADVGSIWRDSGGTLWTLLKVISANQLLFLSNNIGASATRFAFKADIAPPLTYVSHGVNTSSITPISREPYTQVLPAVRSVERAVYAVVDGVRIKLEGAAQTGCDYVDIVDRYNIINPATIGDALRSNRPSGGYASQPDIAVGEALVQYNMTYRITNDGTVLSIYDHKLLGDVSFGYYGGIQYILRNNAFSGGVYRYIPKTKQFTEGSNSYNLTIPYNVTTGALPGYLDLTSSYWENPAIVPDRQVDYMRNAQGSNATAFAGGFLPIYDGEPINRFNKTSVWGFLSGTYKKSYPYAVNSKAFSSGTLNQTIKGMAYKKFQNQADSGSTLGSMYTIPYENDVYLYIDYHKSGADRIDISKLFRGKSLSLVGKSSNVSYSVNEDYLDVTVANSSAYGYLELKATQTSMINNVILYSNGQIFESLQPNSVNSFKISAKSLNNNDISCNVILALYSSENALLKVSAVPKTVYADKNETFTIPIDVPDITGAYVKIFVLNSLSEINPLDEVLVFE